MSSGRFRRERDRQAAFAVEHAAHTGGAVRRWHFISEIDGRTYSAIAATEGGAMRVINAESPGNPLIHNGSTNCPRASRAARLLRAGEPVNYCGQWLKPRASL